MLEEYLQCYSIIYTKITQLVSESGRKRFLSCLNFGNNRHLLFPLTKRRGKNKLLKCELQLFKTLTLQEFKYKMLKEDGLTSLKCFNFKVF